MKAVLTMTMMLGLLITFADAHPLGEKRSGGVITEQEEKNFKLCTQNLVAIGKAVEAYKKEHGNFPDWLSNLHPKYLPDADIFLCPTDKLGGKPIFTRNADPKMPVSYSYYFRPNNRAQIKEDRFVYGDVIPLVGCQHHLFNEDRECLYLSFSLNVYESHINWHYAPEHTYGSPETAITTFENALAQYPDDRRFFDFYPLLLALYTKVGNEESADAMIEHLKSADMIPDDEGYYSVRDILKESGLFKEMLEIFKAAEQRQPDAEIILGRLAWIYERLGNTELAEVYYRKTDPKYELWGKPVTDFSATDLDGAPISMQQYRGKVVLLYFWAAWCGFCTDEMPDIKRVYDTYKEQGFDIIGVSLDDTEKELRDYIKENDIEWRQIFDNTRGEDSLVQQYGIRGTPAPWLIDRDGKLISHKARGEKLEGLVVEALKNKSADQ
ncbi:MAG: redoxin domain-containing protein [Candidatus Poribacteria bacterium]|nr:redoxin domain-containing protein [Candidatus Poribacteria bacterium]